MIHFPGFGMPLIMLKINCTEKCNTLQSVVSYDPGLPVCLFKFIWHPLPQLGDSGQPTGHKTIHGKAVKILHC